MKVWLKPHPATPCEPLVSIRAYARRRAPNFIFLTWIAAGDHSQIVWPGFTRSGFDGWERADNLWQHSCFEAFGRIEGSPEYYELNFATSARWVAYGFADYREGMREADDIRMEMGRWFISERQVKVETALAVPREFDDATWQIGLSVVIEMKDGSKSYWALHHPDPEKPDFHHPDCFALELAPPEQP